jgi:hypothetical protein
MNDLIRATTQLATGTVGSMNILDKYPSIAHSQVTIYYHSRELLVLYFYLINISDDHHDSH